MTLENSCWILSSFSGLVLINKKLKEYIFNKITIENSSHVFSLQQASYTFTPYPTLPYPTQPIVHTPEVSPPSNINNSLSLKVWRL